MNIVTIQKIIFLIFIIGLLTAPSIDAFTSNLTDFREEISEKLKVDNNREEIISFIFGRYIGEEDFNFLIAYFNMEIWAYFGTSFRIISFISIIPLKVKIIKDVYFLKAPIFIGVLKRSQPSGFGLISGAAIGDIYWLNDE
jgi:hypothetical protein